MSPADRCHAHAEQCHQRTDVEQPVRTVSPADRCHARARQYVTSGQPASLSEQCHQWTACQPVRTVSPADSQPACQNSVTSGQPADSQRTASLSEQCHQRTGVTHALTHARQYVTSGQPARCRVSILNVNGGQSPADQRRNRLEISRLGTVLSFAEAGSPVSGVPAGHSRIPENTRKRKSLVSKDLRKSLVSKDLSISQNFVAQPADCGQTRSVSRRAGRGGNRPPLFHNSLASVRLTRDVPSTVAGDRERLSCLLLRMFP